MSGSFKTKWALNEENELSTAGTRSSLMIKGKEGRGG